MPSVDRRLETLRLHYKPYRIVLLLVGESPPPHKGFFYDTKAPEGQLSRSTRKAFEKHFRTEYADREEFLNQFKAERCYLTDLFKERGKTAPKANKLEKEQAVQDLHKFLREERPKVVVAVLKRIEAPVKQAVRRAGSPLKLRVVRYPTRLYIGEYRSRITKILSELRTGSGS